MPNNYLHGHSEFGNLLNILETDKGIISQLIEKDYWIMHVLYGLKQQGFEFELKGGTSLSKGYRIIDRFSEDIDIHIKPPSSILVETNPKNTKPRDVQSRRDFYEWLAKTIKIDGIVSIERDTAFDDEQYYRSGGIRLQYEKVTADASGVKEGILLEVGFDTVTPNRPITISSWAFDKASAIAGIEFSDNRAIDIFCYHPGFTFVEKLQTIATKFRQEQDSKSERPNLMRQYYDLFCLLGNEEVKRFIGTEEYNKHKITRFPKIDLDIPIAKNEAYLLSDLALRARFAKRYQDTASLYYKSQPKFEVLLERIHGFLDRL